MTNGQINIGPSARQKLVLTRDVTAGSGWITALHGVFSLASMCSAMTAVRLQG
jgi:hypothetical protein